MPLLLVSIISFSCHDEPIKDTNQQLNNTIYNTSHSDIKSHLEVNGLEYQIKQAVYAPLSNQTNDNTFNNGVTSHLVITGSYEQKSTIEITMFFEENINIDSKTRTFNLGKIRTSIEMYENNNDGDTIIFQPESGRIEYVYNNGILSGNFEGKLAVNSEDKNKNITGNFETKLTWKCIQKSISGTKVIDNWTEDQTCKEHIENLK